MQLSKCSSSSSAGKSGISYKMLKVINKEDPEFLLKTINDIVNGRCDNKIIAQMVSIPIFKVNKKNADVSDCNAFRQIVLGDVCFKLAESC